MSRQLARSLVAVALACFLASILGTASASADFGIKTSEVVFTNKDGSLATQAGVHPYAMSTTLDFNVTTDPDSGEIVPEGMVKDVVVDLPPGFAVDPNAPRCSNADFITLVRPFPGAILQPNCPPETAVGVFEIREKGLQSGDPTPIYNLTPPPGTPSKLAFRFFGVASAVIEGGLRADGERNLFAVVKNASQVEGLSGSKVTLWGIPADPGHDEDRSYCLGEEMSCPVNIPEKPFITLPRSCGGPLQSIFNIASWEEPERWIRGEAESAAMVGCDKLGFSPSISAQPTTKAAQSPTGLDFSLDIENEGLTSPTGLADSDLKRAVVTLPEGFTANPSLAEGLEVCSQAQLAKETAFSAPGEGCPNAAKIGTVEVETPLLDESLKGSLYVATPYENEFGSLIALYLVIKNAKLGIVVRQGLEVQPDPVTGQLITYAEDLPQLPFSHFRLHFREGGRSPLISPPRCGSFAAKAVLTPWAGGPPVTSTSTFELISGPNNAPCPAGGLPPFKPGFEAGSAKSAAGVYSPFYLRLTRNDGEQDMTKISATLPPGLLGKLAGIEKCSEAQIAAAKARSGPHGAREELDTPSCPASSRIGRTLAGAGVGSQLTYVPGSLYLAGSYKGDPLSIVAITPALAGPFDAGTVVVRIALTLDPRTAQVQADGSASDPIPHILKGIPLNVRDLRVYVDRQDFILNPTSCAPSEVRATLFGSNLNLLDPADDAPAALDSRYQVVNCAGLGFKPKLGLKLTGGTKRGGHPGLTATYVPRKGDANLESMVVRLPRSAFLDQAHIRTICTRVQFAADACPKGAQYGFIEAFTPLLDDPLRGPAWLRSSNHKLPDLVFDLHGLVDVEVATRIDSSNGGIRANVEAAPDAPLTKVVLRMQGAKKGLIVNSRNLCGVPARAKVEFAAQNGKAFTAKPIMRPQCGGKRKAP